jgi:hypothetical protein
MGLLGSIVKTGIELNQKFSFENEAPQKQQETQLRALLEKAKDSSFGKYYGFSELLQSDDLTNVYKNTIPIFDYHQMHDQWWKQQLKFEDITWPGKPNFFALSSGTTGKSSKRIPITSDFLQSMKDVGASQVKSLPDFNFPEELFESEILMLSSSANLSKHENGHLEGEISGINVSNFPDWYETFYRPGKEIAAISNWDERLKKIVEEAPDWNIGVIAGIPSWVLLMLKEIIDYHQLDTIHDIWPNLTVYASGGVAFETFRSDFNQITKRPLTVLDTYLASEGFFAFTARPNTMNMQLALHHGYYYEFVPFDDRGVDEHGNLLDKPCSLSIDQVALDQEYVLIVSTCAGAWRYQIGDVIKFTSLDPIEIKITGRTKFFLNTVGSQLSEEKMDKAMIHVAENLNITVNEYMVAAMKDSDTEEYYHQWVIVSESNVDDAAFKQELDKNLKAANKNYKVARNKALKDVKLLSISKSSYYDFLEKVKKKGGQIKTPKVMTENKMRKLLNLIS